MNVSTCLLEPFNQKKNTELLILLLKGTILANVDRCQSQHMSGMFPPTWHNRPSLPSDEATTPTFTLKLYLLLSFFSFLDL